MKNKCSTWTLVAVFSVLMGSTVLTACGKSGGDSGGGQDAQVCNGTSCSGYVLPQNWKAGAYAQSSGFYIPGYANNGSTFLPRGAMANVLREAMGVCDRNTYSGGIAGCQSWVSGAHDMVIYLAGQQASQAQTAKFIIRSTPGTNYGSWYTYSLPSFQGFVASLFGFYGDTNSAGFFDPMVLDATLWPINNSKGFELRANGPRLSQAWNKLFQLQVSEGKLEDASWSYQLFYNGGLAAEGVGKSCQSQYCGLEQSYFNSQNFNAY